MKRMVVDNPWWSTGRSFEDFSNMKPRLFLQPFMQLVNGLPEARSIILLGPRRVGKTVMMAHAIQRLLDQGVPRSRIIYLSVDTPLYSGLSLERLLELAVKATKVPATGRLSGYYVFFDEIQYLRDWETHLKVLCDTHRGVRFIASGSAAAALKTKSIESGAGRFTHFSLPPLLFCEYLRMVGAESLIVPTKVEWFGAMTDGVDCIDINELNRYFADYINYGGYPEVVTSMAVRNNPGRFIKEDIIDKVLLRDLPGLYGITDMRELYRLFIHIVYRSGEEFSYEDLSKESGVGKETIKRYLNYLESAFLVKVLHKIDENARRFQRVTTFKIYVTNTSLFAANFAPLSPSDKIFHHMVETAVFNQFSAHDASDLYYANWKKGRQSGEVDLVRLDILSQKPKRALEVKWSNRYSNAPGELTSLLGFMNQNSMPHAVVTTISETGRKEVGKHLLQFVPCALYAYTCGLESVK